MAYPDIKLPSGGTDRLKATVAGTQRGRGIRGWQPTPKKIRLGRRLESLSLGLVVVFGIGTFAYLVMVLAEADVAGVKLAVQVAGAVAFVVAHPVPPIVDALTGGRTRVGLWSVLLFWLTFAAFLGLPKVM